MRANPGKSLVKHLHRGFAPPDMRMRLYEIQREIYASYAKKLNATFVQPPVVTLDEHGFLARDFWNIDPTHGNTDYGRHVLNQIEDL